MRWNISVKSPGINGTRYLIRKAFSKLISWIKGTSFETQSSSKYFNWWMMDICWVDWSSIIAWAVNLNFRAGKIRFRVSEIKKNFIDHETLSNEIISLVMKIVISTSLLCLNRNILTLNQQQEQCVMIDRAAEIIDYIQLWDQCENPRVSFINARIFPSADSTFAIEFHGNLTTTTEPSA